MKCIVCLFVCLFVCFSVCLWRSVCVAYWERKVSGELFDEMVFFSRKRPRATGSLGSACAPVKVAQNGMQEVTHGPILKRIERERKRREGERNKVIERERKSDREEKRQDDKESGMHAKRVRV